jgi:hypothetical protein
VVEKQADYKHKNYLQRSGSMVLKKLVVSAVVVMAMAEAAEATWSNLLIINGNSITTTDGFSMTINGSKTCEYIMAAFATINSAFYSPSNNNSNFSKITIANSPTAMAIQFVAYSDAGGDGGYINRVVFYNEPETGSDVVIKQANGGAIDTIKLPASPTSAQVQKFDYTVGVFIKWLLQGRYDSYITVAYPNPPLKTDFNITCKFYFD